MSPLLASTRTLLRNDLRLAWREFFGARKKPYLQFGLILLLFIPLQYGAIGFFSQLKQHPPVYLEGLIWFFFFTLMVGGAMHQAIRILYERSDLDLLLSSPLQPTALLLSRLLLITLIAMASPIMFLFPLLNGLTFGFSARYAGGYATWLLLGGFAATSGIALTLGLVRLIGARRARVTLQVFAAVVGASTYLVFQIRGARGSAFLGHLRELTETFGNNPVSRLVVDAGRGHILPLLALTVLCAGSLWFAARVFGPIFVAGTQDSAERPQARRRSGSYTHGAFNRSLFFATLWKDTRLIFRDTLLLSRVLPSALYIIPAFLATLTAGGSITLRLAPFGFIIATQFSTQLSLVAAAGEECWDLIRMSPASALRVRLAKLAAGLFGPMLLALALALYLAFSGHATVAVWMVLASVACSLACSWLEVASIKPTPRADLLRRHGARKPILRSVAQIFLIITGAASVSLFAYGTLWLALFFFVLLILGVIACFTFVELDDLPES